MPAPLLDPVGRGSVGTTLEGCTSALTPIGLDELVAVAALQTRTDRKYVLPVDALEPFVHALDSTLAGGLAVLEIDDRRAFGYDSVYFDTASLTSYRAAARARRPRWKVRTRTYTQSGDTMLEVKTKSRRGPTVKHRLPYRTESRLRIDDDGRAFVGEHLDPAPPVVDLLPTLVTTYQRATLLDRTGTTRLTVDADLRLTGLDGRSAGLADHVIVETKTVGPPSAADRWLWSHGQRPLVFSKFCVGLAVLHPSLPANRWNLALRRYFGWAPASRG